MEPVVGRTDEQRRIVVLDRQDELGDPTEVVDGVASADLGGERHRAN